MAPIGPDPAVKEALDKGNAVVFFDVALGEGENSAEVGRIKIELFVPDVSKREEINLLTLSLICIPLSVSKDL